MSNHVPNALPERRLLTVPTVAERLQCSQRKVWAMVAAGTLKSVRIGLRGTRIEAAELDRFIEALGQEATHA